MGCILGRCRCGSLWPDTIPRRRLGRYRRSRLGRHSTLRQVLHRLRLRGLRHVLRRYRSGGLSLPSALRRVLGMRRFSRRRIVRARQRGLHRYGNRGLRPVRILRHVLGRSLRTYLRFGGILCRLGRLRSQGFGVLSHDRGSDLRLDTVDRRRRLGCASILVRCRPGRLRLDSTGHLWGSGLRLGRSRLLANRLPRRLLGFRRLGFRGRHHGRFRLDLRNTFGLR